MIWYTILMCSGKICMTRKVKVYFSLPIRAGARYTARCTLLSVEDRDYHTRAWIEDVAGTTCMEVTALFREVKGITLEDVLQRFDFSETEWDMETMLAELRGLLAETRNGTDFDE
jgi:hypothetical protein